MTDGQPDPTAANIFAAAHILNVQGRRQNSDTHEELWSFSVTISKRIKAIPIDRVNQSVYLSLYADSGLAEVVDVVKYSIQNSWNLITRINNQVNIVGNEPTLIIQSIQYTQTPQLLNRTPKPAFRNEEWFHGSHNNPERDGLDGFVGLSLTLDFGDLLKLTCINNETCI